MHPISLRVGKGPAGLVLCLGDDPRREELDSVGDARRLQHGEIGQGLNDYDAIFSTLPSVGFDNWINVEDGVDGFDQLERSVRFLRDTISRYWPAEAIPDSTVNRT